MNDEEIIKALECCGVPYKICAECPMPNDIKEDCRCCGHLANYALDLINRQQAEIKRLKNENKILSKNADTAFQDGLNEAQDLYAEQVKDEIKSKAVREFAERLKEMFIGIPLWGVVAIDKVDSLVKEMVGEKE